MANDGFTGAWHQFYNLPDDVLADLPQYIKATFLAARLGKFAVEMITAGAVVPRDKRAPRRLVLIADNLVEGQNAGPLAYDINALRDDFRLTKRVVVISDDSNYASFSKGYKHACRELFNGADVSIVIETDPSNFETWMRTIHSIQQDQTNFHQAARA